MLTDFHNFSCTTSQENAKVIGVKIYCHTLVMLLPYRVKVSDTKVTQFTPILALCTCLYRSHLGQPVLTKQTKHSRKSGAQKTYFQNVHVPFTQTHAFKRLCHCAIAAAMTVCMHGPAASTPSADVLSTFNVLSTHIMDPPAIDLLLKHTPYRCCSPPDSKLAN